MSISTSWITSRMPCGTALREHVTSPGSGSHQSETADACGVTARGIGLPLESRALVMFTFPVTGTLVLAMLTPGIFAILTLGVLATEILPCTGKGVLLTVTNCGLVASAEL